MQTMIALLVMAAAAVAASAAQTPASAQVRLWPGTAPGETGDIGPEHDTTPEAERKPARQAILRLTNVTEPTLQVFRPAPGRSNGAAVLVCPGGGYSILAAGHEGAEVCRWLNTIGVTGILLKYRVPARKGLPRWTPPLQDAQRAMGLIRRHATEWDIDPRRVGVLGFSAGGHLSAMLSTDYRQRTYPHIDAADAESCRPDFSVLIYPAYLIKEREVTKLAPELKIDAETPPAFLSMALDDPIRVENAIGYALALKAAGVGAELHVYPKGGHGYGLRAEAGPAATWPKRAGEWLKSQGWLEPRQ